MAEVTRLSIENARLDLGAIRRNMNLPTLALEFLAPASQTGVNPDDQTCPRPRSLPTDGSRYLLHDWLCGDPSQAIEVAFGVNGGRRDWLAYCRCGHETDRTGGFVWPGLRRSVEKGRPASGLRAVPPALGSRGAPAGRQC